MQRQCQTCRKFFDSSRNIVCPHCHVHVDSSGVTNPMPYMDDVYPVSQSETADYSGGGGSFGGGGSSGSWDSDSSDSESSDSGSSDSGGGGD